MNKQDREEFGYYLRKLRKDAGLSLRQVKEQSGVSDTYLRDIELGRRFAPSRNTLDKLATLYNVPFEEISSKIIKQDREPNEVDSLTDEEVEVAYEAVCNDSRFAFGGHISEINMGHKRWIVQMYRECMPKDEELSTAPQKDKPLACLFIRGK